MLSSCGGGTRKVTRKRISNYDQIIWPKRERTECPYNSYYLGYMKTHHYKGSSLKSEISNFSDFSTNPVSSTFIEGIYYSERDVYEIEDGVSTLTDSPLDICSGHDYDPDSVEGATLSAIESLRVAKNFYERTLGRSPTPVNVAAFPRIFDRDEYGYESDNAAYFHHEGKDYIFFLPHSYQGLALFGTPIYLNRGVLVHEYGHKVLASLANNSPLDRKHLSFKNRFKSVDAKISSSDTKRSSQDIVYMGIHEAFADLYSFYALDRDFSYMGASSLFQETRDVTKSKFRDGTSKDYKFSWQSLIQNGISCYYGICSSDPKFEEHDIGSMLAYNAHALIQTYAKGDLKKQAKALMKWAMSHENWARISEYRDNNDILKGSLDKLKRELIKLCHEDPSSYINEDQCIDVLKLKARNLY